MIAGPGAAKFRLPQLEPAEGRFAEHCKAAAEGKLTFGEGLKVFKTRPAHHPWAGAAINQGPEPAA